MFDSVTRYLKEEEEMKIPLQWNVRAKCEPDTDNEIRELEEKERETHNSSPRPCRESDSNTP